MNKKQLKYFHNKKL